MTRLNFLNRHLNDQGIALYIEYLQDSSRRYDLPDKVFSHVERCPLCRKRAFFAYDIIRTDPVWREEVNQKKKPMEPSDLNLRADSLFEKRLVAISPIVMVAASVLMLLAASYVFWISPPPSANQTFYHYFQPYPDIVSTRSAHDSATTHFGSAMRYYNNGDYVKAIALLKKHKAEFQDDTLTRLYLGVSYLMENKVDEAMMELKKHPATQGKTIAEVYDWYLALSYLKSGRKTESKSILLTLSQGHSFYSLKARDLLKEFPE